MKEKRMLLTDDIFVTKRYHYYIISFQNNLLYLANNNSLQWITNSEASFPNCARQSVKLRKALLSKMRSNQKYSVDNIKLISIIGGINL